MGTKKIEDGVCAVVVSVNTTWKKLKTFFWGYRPAVSDVIAYCFRHMIFLDSKASPEFFPRYKNGVFHVVRVCSVKKCLFFYTVWIHPSSFRVMREEVNWLKPQKYFFFHFIYIKTYLSNIHLIILDLYKINSWNLTTLKFVNIFFGERNFLTCSTYLCFVFFAFV